MRHTVRGMRPLNPFSTDMYPRFLQLVDLYAQVTRRRAGLLAHVYEVGFVGAGEDRHYGEAQLGVQQRIEFLNMANAPLWSSVAGYVPV